MAIPNGKFLKFSFNMFQQDFFSPSLGVALRDFFFGPVAPHLVVAGRYWRSGGRGST